MAIVLLSGGLDSATALAIAIDGGYSCRALSFRYGQRHARELASARRIARHYRIPHDVVRFDLRAFGGSALTDDIAVPKGRSSRAMGSGIPVTYVPARNTIFLAFALACAETRGASAIVIGVNAVDYSGYPDCRPEFVRAFERLARLATKTGVEREGRRLRIHAPLQRMSKAHIVREAVRLDVPLALTWSCYDPASSGHPCGACDSCQIRAKGFAEAGVRDPLR